MRLERAFEVWRGVLLYPVCLYGVPEDLPAHLLQVLRGTENAFGLYLAQRVQYRFAPDRRYRNRPDLRKQVKLIHAQPLVGVSLTPALGLHLVELTRHRLVSVRGGQLLGLLGILLGGAGAMP